MQSRCSKFNMEPLYLSSLASHSSNLFSSYNQNPHTHSPALSTVLFSSFFVSCLMFFLNYYKCNSLKQRIFFVACYR
uniref:Epimerase family protein SDR39U1 homologic isoform X1 n=1 Tax=Rhizophora mucronata TaxID=61149 RepID=A0A2P2LJ67_RHIMU